MKKLIAVLLIGTCNVSVWACNTVYSDNVEVKSGQILVSNGSKSANEGTWVDPASVTSLKGAKGDTGTAGVQGIQGVKGNTGDTGSRGVQGIAGVNGKDVDPATVNNLNNRMDRLEETKYIVEPVVRLYDAKHFQVQLFDSYDARHSLNSAIGVRLELKLGKSYEERRIEKQEQQIKMLEKALQRLSVLEAK